MGGGGAPLPSHAGKEAGENRIRDEAPPLSSRSPSALGGEEKPRGLVTVIIT